MAQGQKTVILRPEQAMAAIEEHQQAAPAPLPPAVQGKLVIFVPDTDPIVFELMPGITTVGRGMENHLVLGDPYASRKHMMITHRDGQYQFGDTGSDNGTQVNGGRCSSKVLQTGDVVEIGNVMMRFVMGDVRPEHQARPSATPPAKRGQGAPRSRRRKKKKKSQAQLIMLLTLVMATIGLIVMMVLLYLKQKG